MLPCVVHVWAGSDIDFPLFIAFCLIHDLYYTSATTTTKHNVQKHLLQKSKLQILSDLYWQKTWKLYNNGSKKQNEKNLHVGIWRDEKRNQALKQTFLWLKLKQGRTPLTTPPKPHHPAFCSGIYQGQNEKPSQTVHLWISACSFLQRLCALLVCACVCVRARARACVCARAHACVHACACVCMHVRECM